MLFLKILNFGPFHISLNDSLLRSPMTYSAFLSKQQGTTFPSHVITGLNQSRAHLSGNRFFDTYSPSIILYLLNRMPDGSHEPISALLMICIDFNLNNALTLLANCLTLSLIHI